MKTMTTNKELLAKILYQQAQSKLLDHVSRSRDGSPRLETLTFYLLQKEGREGVTYQIGEKGDIECGTHYVKAWTGFVGLEVDTNQLFNSHYLVQQTKVLVYRLLDQPLVGSPF